MKTRFLPQIFWTLLFQLSFAFGNFPLSAKQSQPNIILILADDQGWNSLSVGVDPENTASGSPYFRTPNLSHIHI